MRFKRVYVEIGNICNLNCSFCSELKREKRQMTALEFSHIAKEVKPFCDYLYFHIKGEPLLHPELPTLFDIAKEYNFFVNLTTNGTLLDKTGEMILSKPALRQVNISLHSFPAHKMEGYLKTVLDFSKKASLEHKKYVVLRFWNLDNTRKTDNASLDMLNRIKEYFNYEGDLLDAMKGRSVMLEKGIFISFEEEFEWPSVDAPFISDEGICYGMRSMLGILADGTVTPCCLDANGEAPLGNIFKTPLADMMSEIDKIANNLTNRRIDLELCKHCSYRTRFDKIKTV